MAREKITSKKSKSSKAPPNGLRKKRRFKPGTVALRQIRRYQKTTNLLFPKTPFQRLVREIIQDFRPDTHVSAKAFEVVQEAAEAYLTELLRKTNEAAIFRGAMGITSKDMHHARYQQGELSLYQYRRACGERITALF